MILPNTDQLSSGTPETIEASPAGNRRSEADRAELADLVTRAQAGESLAQTAIVQRYTRRLSGFVRGIVRQTFAVEDIVQTVFIKMFRRLSRLRDAAAFESWLFMLARNTSLDFLRRQRRRPVTVSADEALFEIPDTRPVDGTAEILAALDTALAKLNPQTRNLVSLFVQGCSYHTLAQREGITLGAVKARLHRARPMLRELVGEATDTRLPELTQA